MKCNNCGFEIDDTFTYCPDCGSPAFLQPSMINPVILKFKELLKSKKMLVLCLLITVSATFSLISGSLSVLAILASVFLWICYSKAIKDEVSVTQLRNISGTVYAGYVINYVAYITLLVCGIIFIITFAFLSSDQSFIDSLIQEFRDIVSQNILILIEKYLAAYGFILSLLLTLASIVSIIINAVGMRSIHRFIKTAYTGIQTGQTENHYAHRAKNWLIVFGVFYGISALASLTSTNLLPVISTGCIAAAMFVASSIINKEFL